MSHDPWTVETLLKTSGSYWQSCTLQAGVALGIFTLIGDRWLGADEVAEKLPADLRGITILLNGLTAMGLLVQKEGRYGNVPESKTLLVEDSPRYLGYIIQHHHHLVKAWSELVEAVRTGKPVRGRSSHSEEEERESFLMGMHNLAMSTAPQVAEQVELAGKEHLLDLGGGPGTYAIQFCLANPKLRATVYDLPTTSPFAHNTMAEFGMIERMEFIGGDYLEEEIPGSYDVAWLSHILHGEGPEECQTIINKTVSVLQGGGLILIHDFLLDDTMDGPLFPALFSANMLINTPMGQSYSESQIKEMLHRAGVREISRLPFKGQNDSGIMSGIL